MRINQIKSIESMQNMKIPWKISGLAKTY